MALAQEQVGLLAMGLDCDLNKVSVHRYRVIVESGLNENESQAQQSRKAARLTSIKNNWQPVTDAGLFLVVTLQPLEILNIEIYGFKCTLEPEGEGVLEAAKEGERAAIERLLNQDLYRAALSLAKDRN